MRSGSGALSTRGTNLFLSVKEGKKCSGCKIIIFMFCVLKSFSVASSLINNRLIIFL